MIIEYSSVNMDNIFLIWSRNVDNYKLFLDLLSKKGRVIAIKELSGLSEYIQSNETDIRNICLCILENRDYMFSKKEKELVNDFYGLGHSVIVATCENEDGHCFSNINNLIAQYGFKFNDDCVIRPNLYRHYHPKEAALEDFMSNRGLSDSIKRFNINKQMQDDDDHDINYSSTIKSRYLYNGPRILYAFGCTLQVNLDDCIVMMTSSKWALPSKQAICIFKRDNDTNSRMVGIGSSSIFNDNYIIKEDNILLIEALIEFIINKYFPINISDAKTIEIPESNIFPDLVQLVDTPMPFLLAPDELPEDKSKLVDKKLFNIDNSMQTNIIQAFKDLRVNKEPLALIKPQLDHVTIALKPVHHGFLIKRLPK